MKMQSGRATPSSRTKAVAERTFDFRRMNQGDAAVGNVSQIIDTRPKHYTTKAQDIMEGAVWRDPETPDDWIGTLSKTSRSSHSVSTASKRM